MNSPASPNWPCYCLNWARSLNPREPQPNHHPNCEHYNDSLIEVWSVSFDGASYVLDAPPTEIHDGEAVTQERMHREIYDQLP